MYIMKSKFFSWWILLFFIAVTPVFNACDSDDDEIEMPEIPEEPTNPSGIEMITESNTDFTNYHDIEVGTVENDIMFEMNSTILTSTGKTVERTLNCCAIGALRIEDGVMVSENNVENVTIVNRGTITVHTKDLVEKYKDSIQAANNTLPPYKYLRVLVMYAGKNSTVINDGVINVYFDHDPDNLSTIYVMALVGAAGSSITNNGEINFYGRGSFGTRMRSIGTFGDNVTCVNKGTMTADVEIADDSRMITTGGSYSNVINDGIMKLRLPGKIYCTTRYGNNNLINNNTIEITSVDYPEGYRAFYTDEDNVAVGMYDPLTSAINPPMVNRGTITLYNESTEETKKCFGMMSEMLNPAGGGTETTPVNDGEIFVIDRTNTGKKHIMSEGGFITRKSINGEQMIKLRVTRWRSALRDFADLHDLFTVKGCDVDFGSLQLSLYNDDRTEKDKVYELKADDLFYNIGADDPSLFPCEYRNFENMVVKDQSTEEGFGINWNSENRTAVFSSITNNK